MEELHIKSRGGRHVATAGLGEPIAMRLHCAVAGVCFAVTACLSDDPTTEQPSGPLKEVGPVLHSVYCCYQVVLVDTLAILNAGGAPTAWVARAKGGSAWLSLHDSIGVTPDTLYLEIRPFGLEAGGVYRDTVIVSAVTTASTIAVPVELRVLIPPPPPIDTETPHLEFTVQPTDTKSGAPIAPPVAICSFYKFTINRSFADSVRMTASSAVLTGTVTVQAVTGCATFSDLVISTPGTYTLTGARVPPPPFATSAPFTVTP